MVIAGAAGLFMATASAANPLDPIPEPPENPITEEKRVLGKALFWDEQLSSSDTIACGTCHRPDAGSIDPRIGRNPGYDGVPFTDDDILGSPSLPRTDANGNPVDHPVFGTGPQITGRNAPPVVGSQYMIDLFWDGHAPNIFRDPITGELLIEDGGNFENQALFPILSPVEMAHEKREWHDVVEKLAGVAPLALAEDLPPDVAAAVDQHETYPRLFEAAFGDDAITPTRIAYAIATYERTLFPDQTPWDRFQAGEIDALTERQREGWRVFLTTACTICHRPPVFSDSSFRGIGLRPIKEDGGFGAFLENPSDDGEFKVPSLRNVVDRPRLMHTGQITDLRDAIDFYLERNGHVQFPENQDFLMDQINLEVEDIDAVVDFIENGLHDPRVAAEVFPFDRPTLRSELVISIGGTSLSPQLTLMPNYPNPFPASTTLRFNLPSNGPTCVSVFDAGSRLVRVLVDGERMAGSTSVSWDGTDRAGYPVAAGVYFYELVHERGRVTGRMIYAP
jgi:cytochrome c peroxidase